MLKLNKTQEKLVRQKDTGVSVIKGAGRSGKTAVAINRMLYLAEHACQAKEQVLFVCSHSLKREWVENHVSDYYEDRNLSLFDEEITGEIVIKSIDELIGEAADKADVHLNLQIIDKVAKELLSETIKDVKKHYPKVKWLKEDSLTFIQKEILWMNACGFVSFEDYKEAARQGADIKLPKNGSGRKALWEIKELVSRQLRENGQMLSLQMQLDTLQFVKEDVLRTAYEHVIIDDADVLTKVQLEFIKYLKKQGPGEVLFVMDKSRKINFKSIGYDMTGRVRNLSARTKRVKSKAVPAADLTPLELFMESYCKEKKEEKEVFTQLALDLPESGEKKSILPWYVETYKYINKGTGMETVFQRDSSAGETYIDEVRQEQIESIPVYSDIAAGMPIEIVDGETGCFEIPGELLHHKKNIYMLHVQGDSMTGADISDGDYVVIQTGNVNNNEIAAVYYNGQATLKRISQEDGQILLYSENPKYAPIVIEDGDFRVMGKLVGVIKAM